MKSSSFFSLIFIFNLLLIFDELAYCKEITLVNPKKNWAQFFEMIQKLTGVDTFVETGTYLGDTTAQAAVCFQNVHTIEINDDFYKQAVGRFKDDANVIIHHGDSAKIFPSLLFSLSRQQSYPLFWLDGHYMSCMGDSDGSKEPVLENEFTPIWLELMAIKNNLFKSIILIDDVRLFGTLLHDRRIERAGNKNYPLLSDVCKLLKDIDYSYVIIGDILFAYHKSVELSFSPLIHACTISRFFDGNNFSPDKVLEAEELIGSAKEEELLSLKDLYRDFSMYWRTWVNKSPHYNLWYGLILKKNGDYQEELLSLKDLYRDFSMYWRTWVNKSPHYNLWYGLILKKNGDYQKAAEQFQEVIHLGYYHWRIYWYLAECLYAINKLSECQEALDIVLTSNLDFKPAYVLLEKISKDHVDKNSKKYVIGSWTPGGMGICLHSVLGHLIHCEKNNKTPVVYWGSECAYYNDGGFNGSYNVWEYYFEPISHLTYSPGDHVNQFCQSDCGLFSYLFMSQSMRNEANRLIKKYIKIKPVVQKKIDEFYNKYMRSQNNIGIHIRGTDKVAEEALVNPVRMIEEALKYADNDTQFLIATDEQTILDQAKHLLNGRKVIYYDCYRSETGSPLHVKAKPSFAQLGEDIVVEMSLLAKCDLFLHTHSNVSAVVLYINPNLKNIVLK